MICIRNQLFVHGIAVMKKWKIDLSISICRHILKKNVLVCYLYAKKLLEKNYPFIPEVGSVGDNKNKILNEYCSILSSLIIFFSHGRCHFYPTINRLVLLVRYLTVYHNQRKYIKQYLDPHRQGPFMKFHGYNPEDKGKSNDGQKVNMDGQNKSSIISVRCYNILVV